MRIQALGALVNLSQCDAICNTMRDFHAVELIMSEFASVSTVFLLSVHCNRYDG